MKEKQLDKAYTSWFSTYGMLTAERVLERFGIQLSPGVLVGSLHESESPYYAILHVPMMNIFNGIIFQQAYDYNIYAQKLMIDYRLSPEYAKDADAPGASIREDLNQQYDQLLLLGKAFTDDQFKHYRLISESQAWLIGHIERLADLEHALVELTQHAAFKQQLAQYTARAEEMMVTFRDYRHQFYDLILALTDRLSTLSDYHFDAEHAAKEREALWFDSRIGEA